VIKKISYLILLVVFNLYACRKNKTTTTITGKIIDEVNKQAVQDVSTWLISNDYDTNNSFSDTCFTDAHGLFTLSATGSDLDATNLYIYKPGYVFLDFDIVSGSNLTKNISLSPYDSYITFKIGNKSMYNFIFGTFWSRVGKHEFMSKSVSPIPVPNGTIYEETRSIPGDTYIYVTWDYHNFASDTFFPNLDSIWVPRGDTVIYSITMK
jgi:hypothetical protein